MPWLPLAILLVAVLTIAAIALILYPPAEGGKPAAAEESAPAAEESAIEVDQPPLTDEI